MRNTLVSESADERREFYRRLVAIALPVAFQNLLATTESIVDTLMLARLGENTVAAVGLCAQFSSLMFACFWGFVGGGMLFMSQYWGAKDEDGVCRSFGITQSFMLLVGCLFCFMALVLPETVMRLYTDKAELWPLGVSYFRIVSFSYPLYVAGVGIASMMRSTGRVRLPLIASMVGMCTNIVLNAVLIYGLLGLPALGLRGAALATLIANLVQVGMLMLLAKIRHFSLLFRLRRQFAWTAGFVRQFLKKCFPIICNELLIGLGNMGITVVLGRQSTAGIAAMAVFRTFEGFVIAFFSGFSNASSILVGNAVGAGEHETALLRAKRLIWLNPLIVAAACGCFLLFRKPFLTAMSLSGDSFTIGQQLLIIYSVAAVIRMTNWLHNDTFRAAGDATYGTVLEITFMYAMVLPCICLAGLKLHLPFAAVFACAYIDEPIRLGLMLRHLFSGKWIRPVTAEGIATLDAFREQHGIRPKEKRKLGREA